MTEPTGDAPRPEEPAVPAPETPAPPPTAPDWVGEWSQGDTTWVTPGPTRPVDATPTTVTPSATAPYGGSPTSVDPLAPPLYPPSSYPPPSYPPPAYPPPQYPLTGYGGPPMPGVAGWGAVALAPKPGVVPLRPLSLGEILDGAVTYIRRDPKTVLGISAVIALVQALLIVGLLLVMAHSFDSLLSETTPSGAEVTSSAVGLLTAVLVLVIASSLLSVLATGLLTTVMGQAVLGRRVTLGEVWQRTAPRFWRLLGLTILLNLIVGGVLVGGILLAVLLGALLESAGASGFGILLGFVGAVAVGLVAAWLYVRFLLAPAALILENVGPLRALRRSMDLVKGAWWRTFGIYLLAAIIAYVVGQVLQVPFAVIGTLLGASDATGAESVLPLSSVVAQGLASLISQTVVVPFTAGIVSLLYIDRRIRREALDIELARAAGAGG